MVVVIEYCTVGDDEERGGSSATRHRKNLTGFSNLGTGKEGGGAKEKGYRGKEGEEYGKRGH